MVKSFSPFCVCALGCFLGRYFFFWLEKPGYLFLAGILVLFFSFLSSWFLILGLRDKLPENFEQYRLVLFFFIAGLLTGVSAFYSQSRKFSLPATAMNTKAGFVFELKSDLKPYGDSFYSCDGCLAELSFSGIKQKKTGSITALIPREIVKSPNHKYREVIASGAVLSGTGTVFENKTGMLFLKFNRIEKKEWKNSFKKFRGIIRFRLMEKIESKGNAGGLLYALLTSSKEFLPESFSQYFTKSGCAHVLALSGMHLSIICSLGIFLWKGLMGKKWAFLFGFAASLCFYIFAGGSPSLKRAIIMVFIAGIVKWAGIRIPLISVLSISFVFHTWFFPEESGTVSFILSYGGLLGIILFADSIKWFLEPYIPSGIASSFSASLGAVLMTTGVSALFFGEFYLAGVIASIPVCILVLIFLYAGGLTLILDLFFFLPDFCFFPMEFICGIIEKTAKFFSLFPSVKVDTISGVVFSFGVCLMAGFGIKLLKVHMEKRSSRLEDFDKL